MIEETTCWKFINGSLDYSEGIVVTDGFMLKEHKLDSEEIRTHLQHLLARIYKLEDGTEVVFNDLVWRVKNEEIKSVQFRPVHLEQNTPLFGTRKSCERWLEKNAKLIQKQQLKQNRDSSFLTLKAWVSKLDSLPNLSFGDLEKIREGLKSSIENMERI